MVEQRPPTQLPYALRIILICYARVSGVNKLQIIIFFLGLGRIREIMVKAKLKISQASSQY